MHMAPIIVIRNTITDSVIYRENARVSLVDVGLRVYLVVLLVQPAEGGLGLCLRLARQVRVAGDEAEERPALVRRPHGLI